MRKVLFAIYALGYGGAERSLVNLLQELPKEEYQVDLLLFKQVGDFLAQVPSWVRLVELPEAIEGLYAPILRGGKYCTTKIVGTLCSRLVSKKAKVQTAFRWKHFYAKKIQPLQEHYDVAVAYVGSEMMYFVRDCVQADRKLVWVHNDYRTAGYSAEDDRPYFADMDEIVSVSQECVDVLKQEFPEFREKMHYIQNITSSTLIKKQAQTGLPEEFRGCDVNILSIGRLLPQKGFDLAIEAAQILKTQNTQFRWYIIGEGVLREKLEKQIQDAGLEETVILLGTRKNPYPYIQNCSVLVQSSRFEGKSVVLDEAKILGVPIVATAYPTAADQILQGKEGLIVEMTPEGIAQGITQMLTDSRCRKEILDYLQAHEYGNQEEITKYCALLNK